MNNIIHVRFAPSPTGNLHIGSVRTALFNFLFSGRNKGTFSLRIEDTDRERSKEEYEKQILEDLLWLGMQWTGEVVRQSERLALYQKYAYDLVERGAAYQEQNGSSGAAGAIRFKMPKNMIKFEDLVQGPIEFDATLFDDLVILKSDGFPTYHFACVVDDHEMGITHVIRGSDHISNTPRQLALYAALNWNAPRFGHLPLVFGPDKTPLSKRHGHVSLSNYRTEGFLPHALLNYLALLGWTPKGANSEVLSLEEMIRLFSLEDLNASNACFDLEKLKWINYQHMVRMDAQDFCAQLLQYLHEQKLYPNGFDEQKMNRIALLYKERIKTFREFLQLASFFFSQELVFDPKAVQKYLKEDDRVAIEEWVLLLDRSEVFDSDAQLEDLLRSCAAKLGIKAAVLIHATRVAISGSASTPGLFETMVLLGRETVLKRLHFVLKNFSNLIS